MGFSLIPARSSRHCNGQTHPLTGDQRQILEEAKTPWLRVNLQVPKWFLAQGQCPRANSTLLWPVGKWYSPRLPTRTFPGTGTDALHKWQLQNNPSAGKLMYSTRKPPMCNSSSESEGDPALNLSIWESTHVLTRTLIYPKCILLQSRGALNNKVWLSCFFHRYKQNL